ncbi:MAG: type II toxin-antitoxin system Phd/YefM family antitoxin [Myxococcales bacterium]
MNLSQAKSKLSEVVRTVRRTGEPVTITVDGEAAARVVPVDHPRERLTAAEVATVRALTDALFRISRPVDPFDAVGVISDGRR